MLQHYADVFNESYTRWGLVALPVSSPPCNMEESIQILIKINEESIFYIYIFLKKLHCLYEKLWEKPVGPRLLCKPFSDKV